VSRFMLREEEGGGGGHQSCSRVPEVAEEVLPADISGVKMVVGVTMAVGVVGSRLGVRGSRLGVWGSRLGVRGSRWLVSGGVQEEELEGRRGLART
jgi:hypothetical protein